MSVYVSTFRYSPRNATRPRARGAEVLAQLRGRREAQPAHANVGARGGAVARPLVTQRAAAAIHRNRALFGLVHVAGKWLALLSHMSTNN